MANEDTKNFNAMLHISHAQDTNYYRPEKH